jgi:crotonobetainyl-CoA:carnitine CoA-transferase CaiB-like acyl-CoA transferase
MGALGAIMALFARERTGAGQQVHTNLLNAGIVISSGEFLKYQDKPPRAFADKGQHGLNALHRLYETSDGWIYLASDNEQSWPGVCRALGREGLVDDQRFASANARAENDAALVLELEGAIGEGTSKDWLAALGESGIPSAPVVEEYEKAFFDDPHALANDMVVELQHPIIGSYKLCRNLIKLGDTAYIDSRPTPVLGQHNREVMEKLGYSQAEIDELYEKGVAITEEA